MLAGMIVSNIQTPSAREVTLELVRAASVTNTAGEQAFPDTLLRVLGRLPYFQDHPEDLWAEVIENDPYGRCNVYALVRGSGPATVVLTGHYDVVSVANYGPHADVAFDPDALLPRLTEDLRVNARSEAEQNSYSVRLELQADCFAGVWGNSVKGREAANLTEDDVREAIFTRGSR